MTTFSTITCCRADEPSPTSFAKSTFLNSCEGASTSSLSPGMPVATKEHGLVSKRVIVRFFRETMGIFYWIGVWSLIMPSSEPNTALSCVCAGVGMMGVIGLELCVQTQDALYLSARNSPADCTPRGPSHPGEPARTSVCDAAPLRPAAGELSHASVRVIPPLHPVHGGLLPISSNDAHHDAAEHQ